MFFTEADYRVLTDTSIHEHLRMDVLVKRAWNLGITCPVEALKVRMSAVLACLTGAANMPAKSKKTLLDSLSLKIKSVDEARPHPFPHQERFPIDPALLSPDRYQFAYEAEQIMQGVAIPSLEDQVSCSDSSPHKYSSPPCQHHTIPTPCRHHHTDTTPPYRYHTTPM